MEPDEVFYRTPIVEATDTPTMTATPDAKDAVLSLVQARPNVIDGSTPIQFHIELNHPARLTLSVYSLTGKLLYRARIDGTEGVTDLGWNVRTTGGNALSSGLYVFTLRTEDVSGNRKVEVKKGNVLIRR
jgi:hypothetical protein